MESLTMDQSIRLEEAIKREKGRLLNFIKKTVKKTEDAEDITQDVFLQLTKAFNDAQSIESVTSWIYRVAKNKIIDRYRKKSTINFSTLEGDNEDLSFDDLLPDLSGIPDQQYWQSQVRETLDAALEELPVEQREVFIQQEFEQKSFKEISAKTGLTVNTLISRKRYAILHLRKRLVNLYQEIETL
jgi:RNA polymerase sigma factor (sigma-70 family)